MPSWWRKSSSKEKKTKTNKESIFDTIKRKFRNASEDKCIGKYIGKSGGSRRHGRDSVSVKGSRSVVSSRSTSPSIHVSRYQSFPERPHSQPLSCPALHLPTDDDWNSGINIKLKPESAGGSKPSLYIPLPELVYVSNKGDPTDVESDIATASVSSDSSIDSGDSSSSHITSPLASDCENGNIATTDIPYRVVQKNQSPTTIQKKSIASSKPAPQLTNNKLVSTSPNGGPMNLQDLLITRPGGLRSAPDSSRPSSCRCPTIGIGPEHVLNSGFWRGKPYPNIASGHSSSPGSCHNCGRNSVGAEMSGQMFWQQNRCSPEVSPIPSPRMTGPDPNSRIQSVAVSPWHPRAGGAVAESAMGRLGEVKQQTHRSPLSPTYAVSTTPSAPHSPARAESPTSPGSPWKKGRLLGRGTFGHVYLGFNRESGEMCAMKEVTLFSDDPKSRERAQQLDQEIAMLSRLQHPNIVQYFGSEMVDDKFYIYLEYVSGGSINKLLEQYGQLSESVVRNYTRQILSGLAFLHATNTVHRDIKGANILVDPNGWIKLADFGMAKHISGHSCPFSLKGSPYWMAPEVIKNSKGCNLAVDIWSLGCTVLEMLTTKPPWSQYEGVAAMFKIGVSKEFPAIPENLSEDGKDFVRLCLQWNPQSRPSAAQLLEHPFVGIANMERPILTSDPSEAPDGVINAVRSLAIGPVKHNLGLDSEGADIYPTIRLRAGSGSSDARTPRIISCPASPCGSRHMPSTLRVGGTRSPSPLPSRHSASGSPSTLRVGGMRSPSPLRVGGTRSPSPLPSRHSASGSPSTQCMCGTRSPSPLRMGGTRSPSPLPSRHSASGSPTLRVCGTRSPSPLPSRHSASGSPTPLTSGVGAIPYNQMKQPIFSYEAAGQSQSRFYSNRSTAPQEPKHYWKNNFIQ